MSLRLSTCSGASNRFAGCGASRPPAVRLGPRRQHTAALAVSSAVAATEQLTQVAARLSTVRCRELLAASCVELLKAALVGSETAAAGTAGGQYEAVDASLLGGSGDSGSSQQNPEDLLDSLHATLQASLQDVAHRIAPEHQAAWAESQWEAFHEAHAIVQQLLYGLHTQAARAGSATGALQVARCLEHGLLVPQNGAAAFKEYKQAAALGSAEGSLRCGIHYFEGTAPGGRDGPLAYDCFSQALDLAEASKTNNDDETHLLPDLAPATAATAVDGDVPHLLSSADVRSSAQTWMGRCYMEGAGVERSIAKAAECFQRSGNKAELQEIASLKKLYAEVDVNEVHVS